MLLFVSYVACGCNLFGSVRDDCEQTTGRCICRQHVTGQKCNICANGKELGPQGCIGRADKISMWQRTMRAGNISSQGFYVSTHHEGWQHFISEFLCGNTPWG